MVINVYEIIINHYLQFLNKLYSFLSAKEKEHVAKFVTPELCNNYIITRAVLRTILAQHLNIRPHAIEFITNFYGKPTVKGNQIKFNVSHSANVAYYAISSNIELGIDVELLNNKRNIISIAKSVFSIAELDFFLKLPDCKQQTFFFEAWTKKEAVVKAIGTGLFYPIKKVDILKIESDGYFKLQEDQYYLHKLTSCEHYQAHLAVKNQSNTVINQHQTFGSVAQNFGMA